MAAALALWLSAAALTAQDPNPPVLTPDEQKLAAEARKLNRDAVQLYHQGKAAETVATLRQLLEILQKLYPAAKYPDGHPHLAASLNNMGCVMESAGSAEKALPFYEQVLAMYRQANLEPPTFDDRRASFLVIFRNHTLMSPEAIRWLNQFAALPLHDRQRVALAYLRQHDRITNADYRRLNRVEAAVAGQESRGLVDAELVEQDASVDGRLTV
jgi:hypothetical protein